MAGRGGRESRWGDGRLAKEEAVPWQNSTGRVGLGGGGSVAPSISAPLDWTGPRRGPGGQERLREAASQHL